MTDGAWIQGMKDLLMLPDRDLEPAELEHRGQTYRRHLQCLTDRQWFHAVSEAIRLEKMFPAVATLLEYGDTTPPQLVDWTGKCGLCDGSGFEPFERDGHSWVRYCPRGCKPHNDKLDGPKSRDNRTSDLPFPDAKGILERLQAICREKTAQWIEGFKYLGIEADMAVKEPK